MPATRSLAGLLALFLACGCSPEALSGLGAGGGETGLEVASETRSAWPSGGAGSELVPPEVRAAYIAAVQSGAGAEHAFRLGVDGAVAAGSNAAQGFEIEVGGEGLRLAAQGRWTLGLRWTGVGREGTIEPVPEPAAGIEVDGSRATVRRGEGLEEWYLSGPLGLEQGFVIAQAPEVGPPDAPVAVEIEVSGGEPVLADDGESILLQAEHGGAAFRYTDLYAQDAAGRWLEAWMAVGGR
ncbi:MAG: hypothetical protein HY744_23510, partial [Deltaproteobacteria bacterium]|nr:hypothetical protein [Deltaproteobacteria bacterium]